MPQTLDSKYIRGLDKAVARMEKMRGKPLETRTAKALLEGARLMVAPIRAAAPREAEPGTPTGPWAKDDGPGQLARAVKARKGISGPMVAVVGPTHRGAPHRHLVVHGHRVWAPRPVTGGGHEALPTRFRTKPNAFLDRAAAANIDRVTRDVIKLIADTER